MQSFDPPNGLYKLTIRIHNHWRSLQNQNSIYNSLVARTTAYTMESPRQKNKKNKQSIQWKIYVNSFNATSSQIDTNQLIGDNLLTSFP